MIAGRGARTRPPNPARFTPSTPPSHPQLARSPEGSRSGRTPQRRTPRRLRRGRWQARRVTRTPARDGQEAPRRGRARWRAPYPPGRSGLAAAAARPQRPEHRQHDDGRVERIGSDETWPGGREGQLDGLFDDEHCPDGVVDGIADDVQAGEDQHRCSHRAERMVRGASTRARIEVIAGCAARAFHPDNLLLLVGAGEGTPPTRVVVDGICRLRACTHTRSDGIASHVRGSRTRPGGDKPGALPPTRE